MGSIRPSSLPPDSKINQGMRAALTQRLSICCALCFLNEKHASLEWSRVVTVSQPLTGQAMQTRSPRLCYIVLCISRVVGFAVVGVSGETPIVQLVASMATQSHVPRAGRAVVLWRSAYMSLSIH